jgi:lysozyme
MAELGAKMTMGFEGYRSEIYLDTLGNPTGGYGTHLYTGREIPEYIWSQLFWIDYERSQEAAAGLGLDLELDPIRRAVVVDLIYNLGVAGFKKFRRFRAAIARGAWREAADELVNSKWFRQVGRRGPILAYLIETGDVRILTREGII